MVLSLDVFSSPRTRVLLENVAAHVHRAGITMIAPAIVTCTKTSPNGTTSQRFPNSLRNHQLRIRRERRRSRANRSRFDKTIEIRLFRVQVSDETLVRQNSNFLGIHMSLVIYRIYFCTLEIIIKKTNTKSDIVRYFGKYLHNDDRDKNFLT